MLRLAPQQPPSRVSDIPPADVAAIGWLVALSSGETDIMMLAQFEEWLDADEGNLSAFDAACSLWDAIGQPLYDGRTSTSNSRPMR